jgi:transposase
MAGKLPMGQEDLLRIKVMEQVKAGKLTLAEAAVKLRVSYRQAKRIKRRYEDEGAAGIVHRLRGKASNNRLPEELKARVLEAYQTRYEGFGPTFAREKLSELDGVELSRESLRQLLIREGLWERKKRRRGYHARRQPRERFGELVQFDGSHHDWFEGRAPRCCLMNMVDDATGTTLSFLREQKTTDAAMELLWAWIERFGIPQAVYCDRKNAFVLDREPTIEEQIQGVVPRSPFEIACGRLGIEVIVARSPEAKGRVERNHAVYQDRFVKELRLAGISTMGDANRFLCETYLPAINKRFARPPEKPEDAHVPLLDGTDLRDILCRQEERVVSRDHILQVGRKFFMVPKTLSPRPMPGARVIVRKWLDGSIHFSWKGKPLLVEEYEPRSTGKERPVPLSA